MKNLFVATALVLGSTFIAQASVLPVSTAKHTVAMLGDKRDLGSGDFKVAMLGDKRDLGSGDFKVAMLGDKRDLGSGDVKIA